MNRLALITAAALLAAGCSPTGAVISKTELSAGDIKNFKLLQGPVVTVPEWKGFGAAARRDTWIRAQIESVRYLGWESVQPNLVAVGVPAVPLLIENLGRKDYCYRTRQGTFSVGTYGDDEGFELGEMVHHLLRGIIRDWSNYQGDIAELPLRDPATWQKWYQKNRSGLKIGHRRN